ncbi:MAG: BamA/TamA family outer membrane protein [Deltaproteobacteria bacterium]|nr:BamA/TamA family outer membrane protein [Deltaproteobacteria bacterium]
MMKLSAVLSSSCLFFIALFIKLLITFLPWTKPMTFESRFVVVIFAFLCFSNAVFGAQTASVQEPSASLNDTELAENGASQKEAGPPRVAPSSSQPLVAPADLETKEAPLPVLENVVFENRVYFKETTITRYVQSAIGDVVDRALLESDRRRLVAEYKARGFLLAEVSLRFSQGTTPYATIVTFVIEAGERSQLREVLINGNRHVPTPELKKGLFAREPEPLGVFTRAGAFHRPFVERDTQIVQANLYRFGHLEGRVVSSRVSATRDLDALSLSFDVVEGPIYDLVSVHFLGDMPEGMTQEDMRAEITVKDGEVCDLVSIQQDADKLLNPFRDNGYPFARLEQRPAIHPAPSKDPARRGISLTYIFAKGAAQKINEIKLVGNTSTADHVILRDVELTSGELYSKAGLARVQKKLFGLGYFSKVTVREVPSTTAGFVDVEIAVVEQFTLIPSFLPAFVQNEGIVLVGLAMERNLLGTGMIASANGQLSLNLSDDTVSGGCLWIPQLTCPRQLFNVSIMEPRFLDTRIQLSGEAHRNELLYRGFSVLSEIGAGARASIPFTADILGGNFYFGGGLLAEYTGVNLGRHLYLPSPLLPVQVLRGGLDATMSFDSRDNFLTPQNGVYANLRARGVSLLSVVDFENGSTPVVVEGLGTLKLYWTPALGITLKSQTILAGVVNPLGGEVPVTERFFLGGVGSIRGFAPRAIAAVRELEVFPGLAPSTCGGQVFDEGCSVAVGGTLKAVQSAEVEFTLYPDTPFRGFLFVDVGNSIDPTRLPVGDWWQRNEAGQDWLYLSVGFGVLVQIPGVPLRFEFSYPLNELDVDTGWDVIESVFQPRFFFGLGSAI